jgi:hypothetical protein
MDIMHRKSQSEGTLVIGPIAIFARHYSDWYLNKSNFTVPHCRQEARKCPSLAKRPTRKRLPQDFAHCRRLRIILKLDRFRYQAPKSWIIDLSQCESFCPVTMPRTHSGEYLRGHRQCALSQFTMGVR